MVRRRAYFWALGILIAALGFQLFIFPQHFTGPDTRKYLEIAFLQQDGTSFWTNPYAFNGNYWPRGYPTFLSVSLRVTNGGIVPIQVVQILMGLCLAVIAYVMAKPLVYGLRLAVLATIAFSPSIWSMARTGGYEILLSLLMCASVALIWRTSISRKGSGWWPRWGAGLLSGLVFGLAILVQGKALIILPVLLFLAWKKGKLSAAALLAGTVAGVLPWSVRNLLVLGTVSPFSTNGPINVWIGNNPDNVTGGFMEPPKLPHGGEDFLGASLSFIVSQPEAAFALLLRRAVRLIEPVYVYPDGPIPGPLRVIFHLFSISMTSLLLLGFVAFTFGMIWRVRPGITPFAPLALVVLLFYAVNLPFLAEPRFLSPMTPIVAVVAIPTLWSLLRLWFRDRQLFVPHGLSRHKQSPGMP